MSQKTIHRKKPSRRKIVKAIRKLQETQRKLKDAQETLSTATKGLITPPSPTSTEPPDPLDLTGKEIVVSKEEGKIVLHITQPIERPNGEGTRL